MITISSVNNIFWHEASEVPLIPKPIIASRPFFILTMDGGGIKGGIPAAWAFHNNQSNNVLQLYVEIIRRISRPMG